MGKTILEAKHITKLFPGMKALDDVDFDLQEGEVHILVGENGAGKSTLSKVLLGAYKAEQGEIFLDGQPLKLTGTKDAIEKGIVAVYQENSLVPYLNAAQNIFLNREPKTALGLLDLKKMNEDAKALLKTLNCEYIDVTRAVSSLSVAEQQMVEIAKALSFSPRIIVFDEPTSTLSEREVESLFVQIRKLKSEGLGIIYVSHRMQEFPQIGDRITVLRDGKKIGCVGINECSDAELVKMMVGRDVQFTVDKAPSNPGEVILDVENLCVESHLHKKLAVNNVSLQVRAGEIVCIAGIDGNGQSEFIQGLTGLEKLAPHANTKITLGGVDITKKSIRERSKAGMSHVPEDRHKHGLVLDYTLEQNMVLQRYWEPQFQKNQFIKTKEVSAYSQMLIDKYDVRSGQGNKTIARAMSGGNQQKAIVGRELDKAHSLLIAVQPTRGLDVGAIEYLHKAIIADRDAGKAVLLVSYELEEVLNLSDRILVMYEGEIVGELDPKTTTPEELGLYMAGAKRNVGQNTGAAKEEA